MPPREKLKEYQGILFDPETGKSYYSAREGELPQETRYTFERATWTGPFRMEIPWPWLNPISFATTPTALDVYGRCVDAIAVLNRANSLHLAVMLDEEPKYLGPFTRTIERQIVVLRAGDPLENFSAGQIAGNIIRRGEAEAMKTWVAEVLHAYRNRRREE